MSNITGTINCPICKKNHIINIQEEDIHKLNLKYACPIYICCENTKEYFEGNIIIINGRIIKFVNNDELKDIDINELKN